MNAIDVLYGNTKQAPAMQSLKALFAEWNNGTTRTRCETNFSWREEERTFTRTNLSETFLVTEIEQANVNCGQSSTRILEVPVLDFACCSKKTPVGQFRSAFVYRARTRNLGIWKSTIITPLSGFAIYLLVFFHLKSSKSISAYFSINELHHL